jgi:Stigma-specific protein, Stig1
MSACLEVVALFLIGCSAPPPTTSSAPCDPPCADVETCCEGICTTLSTDNGNCGACGVACSVDCCDGQCVDTATDPLNCGSCGNDCGENMACCTDACADLATDVGNCGACEAPCANGQSCDNGNCG